jgi:hypothetical protein
MYGSSKHLVDVNVNSRARYHETTEKSKLGRGIITAVEGGVHKRKAVPPGYLQGYLQARQRLKSMGLEPLKRFPITSRHHSAHTHHHLHHQATSNTNVVTASTSAPPQPAAGLLSEMLPLLFKQRKKYLQRQRLLGTSQQYSQQRPGEPAGLLSLPEDVLLKIVCHLQHDEIKPLFQVCNRLSETLHNAIRFHFNFATPFRPIAEMETQQLPCGGIPGRPDRQRKRAVTNLSAVMARLSRGGRMAAVSAARKSGMGGDITSNGAGGSGSGSGPRTLTFRERSFSRPSPPLPMSHQQQQSNEHQQQQHQVQQPLDRQIAQINSIHPDRHASPALLLPSPN